MLCVCVCGCSIFEFVFIVYLCLIAIQSLCIHMIFDFLWLHFSHEKVKPALFSSFIFCSLYFFFHTAEASLYVRCMVLATRMWLWHIQSHKNLCTNACGSFDFWFCFRCPDGFFERFSHFHFIIVISIECMFSLFSFSFSIFKSDRVWTECSAHMTMM